MNTLRLVPVILILIVAPALRGEIAADQSADLVLGRKFGYQNAFGDPAGVAVDPTTHKVFIADAQRHRVLRFASPASLINGSAAEAVLGQPNFTSLSAGRTFEPATILNRMNGPGRIHCDSAGRLWVCDSDNHRVLRYAGFSSIGNNWFVPNGVAVGLRAAQLPRHALSRDFPNPHRRQPHRRSVQFQLRFGTGSELRHPAFRRPGHLDQGEGGRAW